MVTISGPPAVSFYAMLSGLGDTLQDNAKLAKQQQIDQARKDAFSSFTALDPSSPDYGRQALGVAQKLGSVGDQDGAVKFISLAQSAADRTRQVDRDRVGDSHWDQSFTLQKRTADRQDQTPEEKAAERATAAQRYGIDPNSAEGRQFVLTGALPAPPQGFQPTPGGGYKPIPGGPADPSYIRDSAAAGTPNPDQIATQRAAVARQYGIDITSPQGKAFILTGKLPEQDTSFSTVVEQRKQAASANGLDPASPGYQSFVLTGKMPREDAQPLTATDKKAVLEADEKVQGGQQVIQNLQRAKLLSKQAFSGPAAAGRGYAASFLGDTSDTGKAGIATTDMNNLVTTNAVTQLKAIFGGNPTEGERAILLDIQGSASQPDAIRQKIFDRGIEAAQKRLAFEQQRADELRGGTFYKKDGGTSKATTQPTGANGVPAPSAGAYVWTPDGGLSPK